MRTHGTAARTPTGLLQRTYGTAAYRKRARCRTAKAAQGAAQARDVMAKAAQGAAQARDVMAKACDTAIGGEVLSRSLLSSVRVVCPIEDLSIRCLGRTILSRAFRN